MIDNPNVGNQQNAGGQDANPEPSTGQSQPSEGNFAELIAGLQKRLETQDGEIRALKSGKDKAVSRVEKSNEEMLAKLAKYLDVDERKVAEAQRQSVLDDLVAERVGGRQPVSSSPGKDEGKGGTVELQFIDNALELPADDSRVTDLKLKYGSDPASYLREGMKLKSQFIQQNPPSPAEMPLPQGQAPKKAETQAQLEADYQKAVANVKRGDVWALSEVQRQFRERARKEGYILNV